MIFRALCWRQCIHFNESPRTIRDSDVVIGSLCELSESIDFER